MRLLLRLGLHLNNSLVSKEVLSIGFDTPLILKKMSKSFLLSLHISFQNHIRILYALSRIIFKSAFQISRLFNRLIHSLRHLLLLLNSRPVDNWQSAHPLFFYLLHFLFLLFLCEISLCYFNSRL